VKMLADIYSMFSPASVTLVLAYTLLLMWDQHQ
jgi:hypothetical protein